MFLISSPSYCHHPVPIATPWSRTDWTDRCLGCGHWGGRQRICLSRSPSLQFLLPRLPSGTWSWDVQKLLVARHLRFLHIQQDFSLPPTHPWTIWLHVLALFFGHKPFKKWSFPGGAVTLQCCKPCFLTVEPIGLVWRIHAERCSPMTALLQGNARSKRFLDRVTNVDVKPCLGHLYDSHCDRT